MRIPKNTLTAIWSRVIGGMGLRNDLARRNQRSIEAVEYRKLYKTARWRNVRASQLRANPLCQRHLKRGEIVVATVCHHVEPHKGDLSKFFAPANLESVCKSCHDADIQSEEKLGYSKEIGVDGWPTRGEAR